MYAWGPAEDSLLHQRVIRLNGPGQRLHTLHDLPRNVSVSVWVWAYRHDNVGDLVDGFKTAENKVQTSLAAPSSRRAQGGLVVLFASVFYCLCVCVCVNAEKLVSDCVHRSTHCSLQFISCAYGIHVVLCSLCVTLRHNLHMSSSHMF